MAQAKTAAPSAAPASPISAEDVAAPPAADKAALKAHHAIVRRQTKPWWASLIPDMRGWVAAGFFALAAYLIYMIGQNAKLLDSAPFMQFAGMIMTGGVLLVGNFLFGGNKNGADTSARMVDALKDSNPPPGS
jgi:hypothetical protein